MIESCYVVISEVSKVSHILYLSKITYTSVKKKKKTSGKSTDTTLLLKYKFKKKKKSTGYEMYLNKK